MELVEQLMDVEYGYFWTLLGLVLLILEAMGGALALASLGVGALITAVFAYLGLLSLPGLLGVFAVTAIVLFAISRPLANRITSTHPSNKTNVEAMVGKEACVVKLIDGRTSAGYVKLAGDEWRAITNDGVTLHPGTRVIIRGMEGATVFVTPLEEKEETHES